MNEKESFVYLKVYKGKYFTRKLPCDIKYKKVIVFDLDETLGSFFDLEILWRKVQYFEPHIHFNALLDIYPEFLRYGILSILDYLYQKKKMGECDFIYIYTNNQCSPSWVKHITQYFHYKVGGIYQNDRELFDKIISAFKINNQRVESWRTTHSKTYNDFRKCTFLPKSTEICFVDNSYFIEMNREHVYYIKPCSYYHSLSIKTIIDRYLDMFSNELNRTHRFILLKEHFSQFKREYNDWIRHLPNPEVDKLVAEKMMVHIQEFFQYNSVKRKTFRLKPNSGNFTRKKRK
jgi:hypothetical protein